MNLSHRLLSSALLAGAVFSITALPLTTLGAKSVTVQLEETPVFVGQLRELASPYLALATGISLGVGAVSLSLSSWRQAAHKLDRSEAEIAALKQQLSEKDALVERLRFSDTRLQSSGLEHFLQIEEAAIPPSAPAPVSIPQALPRFSRPELPQTLASFDRSVGMPAKFPTAGLEFFLDDDMTLEDMAPEHVTPPDQLESVVSKTAQPISTNPVRTLAYSDLPDFDIQPITEPVKIEAVSSLPAAQSFRGFVRSDLANGTASMDRSCPEARSRPNHPPTVPSPQLSELLGYLKHVMTQIEQLQASQSSVPGGRNGL
jgi:hypothetical protein